MSGKASGPGRHQGLRLAVERTLPPGWEMTHSGVDLAPRRWLGSTRAVTVSFRHKSLKFALDGTSRAEFQLWRTPLSYAGEEIPSDLLQPGGAVFFGTSSKHKWFMEGLQPEEREWRKVLRSLQDRFLIQRLDDNGMKEPVAPGDRVHPAASQPSVPGN